MTQNGSRVMSAPEAAHAAGITYRQLDYWDRTGWIKASQVDRVGAGRPVRRYSVADVVRLQALAHLGRSGVELRAMAPSVGLLGPSFGQLLVAGPFDLRETDPVVSVIAQEELLPAVSRPGRWVVYDPGPLLGRLLGDDVESSGQRSAAAETAGVGVLGRSPGERSSA